MTKPDPFAPFFRRDGTPRELTIDEYARMAGMTPSRALQFLNNGVATGQLRKAIISKDKISAFSIVRRTA